MSKIKIALLVIIGILNFACYSNADSDDLTQWSIDDKTPANPVEPQITKVMDQININNHFIKLSGNNTLNSFVYSLTDEQKFKGTATQIKAKFYNDYKIYFKCNVRTSENSYEGIYICYAPNGLGNNDLATTRPNEIVIGLNQSTMGGNWFTFSRNLTDDLKLANPNYDIHSIISVIIRGNGEIDRITFSNEEDYDMDGIPDSIENSYDFLDSTYQYDAKEDPDGDGLTNLGEYNNNSDYLNSDTDNDGLSDGYEVHTALSNPNVPDSNEDFDRDGKTTTEEFQHGTDPLNPFDYVDITSGETENIDRWHVYDNSPRGQILQTSGTVYPENKIISLSGGGIETGFQYKPVNFIKAFITNWRMLANGPFKIYFRCHTDKGTKSICYTSDNTQFRDLGKTCPNEVVFGLGERAQKSKWIVFERNLQKDFNEAPNYKDTKILFIFEILFRGNMLIDKIAFNDKGLDSDNDGMSNIFESKYGLDSSNYMDADYDMDSDGLTNLEEFQLGTDPTSADTDKDSMPDYWEVNNGNTNPTVADREGDADNDGKNNIAEYQFYLSNINSATSSMIIDDAENEANINNWHDKSRRRPGKLEYSYEYDSINNRVIAIYADNTKKTFKYILPNPAIINPNLFLEWEMKLFSAKKGKSPYRVQLGITHRLTDSKRHYRLFYVNRNENFRKILSKNRYQLGIKHLVSTEANNKIRRNIHEDLKYAFNGNNIYLQDMSRGSMVLNSITFMANGLASDEPVMHIDNIKLLSYQDTDKDLIPDYIEESIEGLNKYDHLNSIQDLDNDGLNNSYEYIRGMNIENPDSDGDNLPDYYEVYFSKTNPLLSDSNYNGINDRDEISRFNEEKTNIAEYIKAEKLRSNTFLNCSEENIIRQNNIDLVLENFEKGFDPFHGKYAIKIPKYYGGKKSFSLKEILSGKTGNIIECQLLSRNRPIQTNVKVKALDGTRYTVKYAANGIKVKKIERGQPYRPVPGSSHHAVRNSWTSIRFNPQYFAAVTNSVLYGEPLDILNFYVICKDDIYLNKLSIISYEDDDNDQLPDAIEYELYGTLAKDGLDVNTDYDQDGVPDTMEFINNSFITIPDSNIPPMPIADCKL